MKHDFNLFKLKRWPSIPTYGFIPVMLHQFSGIYFYFCSRLHFFMLIPHLEKKKILNSSDYFLARLSWLTVLLNLASFKAQDAFKWKVVIKNLEQEAEALNKDRKILGLSQCTSPWASCSQHTAGNLQAGPRNPTLIMATQPKWVAYEVIFLWENHWWTSEAEILQKVLFM